MPTFTRIGDGDAGAPLTWIDLDLASPDDAAWLAGWDGLGDEARERLLAPVPSPHREHLPDGLLVSLRALRTDGPNALEDVADFKILVRTGLVVTAHDGDVLAVDELNRQLKGSHALVTAVDLLAFMVAGMTRRLEGLIYGIVQQTDTLEDQWLDDGQTPSTEDMQALRRCIIRARRRLGGVRQVLVPIITDPAVALDADDRATLSRSAEHVSRYIDALEECAARLRLLAEQMEAQQAATMTRASLNLTIVATVFLPLTFMSGLLGMNVAGIPEEHNPFGFWLVSGLSLVVAGLLWVLLRRRMRY